MGGTTRRRRNRASRPAVAPLGARGRSRFASAVLAAFVLAAAAAFAYQTSFAGVFVFDDEFAIQRNPNIRTLWPLTRALSAPPESPVSARPVASLTLAVNYALAPLESRDVMAPGGPSAPPELTRRFLANVWGYHFLNLTLHLFAALTVCGVVRRTLVTDRLRPSFGPPSSVLALVVALVWAVHPLTTDAVTYVTQRTEVLMGLFYLLTLYCAIRGADSGIGRARQRWWTAASVVACTLGMGSKQTMVTAPFVVLLWDWMFRPRTTAAAAPDGAGAGRLLSAATGWPRWRLYAGLAATWVVLAGGLAVERWPHSIGIDREGWTPWTYLLTQAGVIVHYLRLSFVPTPLVLDYDGWPMARSVLDVAPQVALLGVLVGATVVALVRRAPWGFAGAWCVALLAPSSSVLPLATEIAAERRMYTALVGIVALAVIGAYALGRHLLDRLARGRPKPLVGRVLAAVAVVGVAGSLAWLTLDRNRDYWSEERIWRDTVDKRPDNPRARLNLGVVLGAQRRYPDAEVELRESLRLKEPVAKTHLNLGSILCAQQRFEEGVPHLQRAIALDPELSTAQANLGEAYGALGRRAEAARHFALALEWEPDKLFLLNRLGWLLATSPEDDVRDAARAIELGERAVRLTSRRDALSLDTLAAAYAEAGRFGEAAGTVREALGLLATSGAVDRSMADRLSLYMSGRAFREAR
jgi:tetratricopeptide (TPR) repeat protein